MSFCASVALRVTLLLAIFVASSCCTVYTFIEPESKTADWANITVWSPPAIPADGDTVIVQQGTLIIWGYTLRLAGLVIEGTNGVIIIDSAIKCGNITIYSVASLGLSNSTLRLPTE